ncbi:Usp domain-containing protein [Mycena indigotica]|uniref:Usp domain-containing protein n=1 Tax=Mycena indigotica TaxID=2126181 RepID=A0A8H6VZ36_9AGAR|nr:Usp domain-containing protein [Mycena indigotica]KAF7299087.1 Usp domain-containing protein [Mycena indigotica]
MSPGTTENGRNRREYFLTFMSGTFTPTRIRPIRRSTNSSIASSIADRTQLDQLDKEASQLIINALERTSSAQPPTAKQDRGSFSKMSFSSMMGGLSGLSLSRTSTNTSTTGEAERGRSVEQSSKANRSSSHVPRVSEDESRSRSRARSQSPFSFRRFRQQRDPSPTPQALPLTQSDIELSEETTVRPRNAFVDENDDSGDETANETEDEDDWDNDDLFDPVTERNTEHNSIVTPAVQDDVEVDPLGEGVNVVVPPDPYFPSTLSGSGSVSGRRNPRRRKSTRLEPLELHTSRPVFQRDRCTITIKQGDPEGKLGNRRPKRYIVASDLSEESRYAVEWGIGTVIRDGDEMMIVNVMENENKVDPPIPNAADRATKLRSQQERQGLAYILCRQATGLLQRTKLHVTVVCQAWHAKNARHMLLDVVDYHEPTMLIVGSRGMGQLKGILLGSTSHYLVEKCSVPVMVARRRLKRPPRRSAHLATGRAHVSLAEAGIDRVARKVDADVQVMRDELQREDERRDVDATAVKVEEEPEEEDGDEADEAEEAPAGVKVPG